MSLQKPSSSPPLAAPPGAEVLSLEQLYDEYARFVFRVLRRWGLSGGVLEEGVQDVFFVAHRRILEFDGRSPKAWLAAIARRVASDSRKREKRHDLCGRASEHGRAIEQASLRDLPDADEQKVAADLVHLLLNSLSVDRREVFVLSELEGMSMPEVSEALAIKLNTAYSRLRTAKLQLKAEYARLVAGEKWRHL